MKKIFFITTGIFILLVTTAQSKKYILQNINVIDVANERIFPHQFIVIAGQRIESIQPLSGFSASTNDSIIDGTDKYIIPGLWDMHVHVWSDAYFFPLFIANGVTGFRDMFGFVKS
jgi:adenine deaminase